MQKKEYMAPQMETIILTTGPALLQASPEYEETPHSIRYRGDDEGWGEGE